MNYRHRIGIINDYRNTYAFLDARRYGELYLFDACLTSGPPIERQKPEDAIHLFFDFRKVATYQTTEKARDFLTGMSLAVPNEARKDFIEHWPVVLAALGLA